MFCVTYGYLCRPCYNGCLPEVFKSAEWSEVKPTDYIEYWRCGDQDASGIHFAPGETVVTTKMLPDSPLWEMVSSRSFSAEDSLIPGITARNYRYTYLMKNPFNNPPRQREERDAIRAADKKAFWDEVQRKREENAPRFYASSLRFGETKPGDIWCFDGGTWQSKGKHNNNFWRRSEVNDMQRSLMLAGF